MSGHENKWEALEPVPTTIFYEEDHKYSRPTISELRAGKLSGSSGLADSSQTESLPSGHHLGMWDGVFSRCLWSIFGVLMFLRIGWMTGQAGVVLACVIVLLCSSLSLITALSLSAICTNGEIKRGGAYYMISRSLGPAFGGAIGVLLYLGTAMCIALYVFGFAEGLVTLLQQEQNFEMIDGDAWDMTVYGLIVLIILSFLSLIGLELATKVEILLLALIVLAVSSVVVGSFVCCTTNDEDQGFVGWKQLNANVDSQFSSDQNFFSVLAVFFPAFTGMMAGANVSGELKDAQESIPIGTLLSIIFSTFVYIILVVVCGAVVVRGDSNGYGLLGNKLIMGHISFWEPLVLIGIFASSLSPAIALYAGAPRILQALAKDRIFPHLEIFEVGYGPNNEPLRAYAMTFLVASISILAGDLNSIASIITNFFLISYAFINYACFAASMTKSPGWRPSFIYYNKWLALLGAVVCIVSMFLIHWISAIVSLIVFLGLYKFLDFTKPPVSWGSATEAQVYLDALTNLTSLATLTSHVKTFRPQILVFVRDQGTERGNLLFAARCCGGSGLTLCAKVLLSHSLNAETLRPILRIRDQTLKQDDLNGEDLYVFFNSIAAPTLHEGWKSIIQASGIGKMRPNIVFFGFKEKWADLPAAQISSGSLMSPSNGSLGEDHVEQYVSMIRDSFDLGYSVGIMRGIREVDQGTSFSGRIDVYWMADDGGLTVLLPHVLQTTSEWRSTSLRVLSKCPEDSNLEVEQERMQTLLKRFRIPSTVKLLQGLTESPLPTTQQDYCSRWPYLSDAISMHKTQSYLRLSEVIRTESMDSDLVVILLPIPPENVEARIYMSWLDSLTRDIPQSLLLRGNQETVLTYYS